MDNQELGIREDIRLRGCGKETKGGADSLLLARLYFSTWN